MAGWIKLYRELIDKPIWQLSTAPQKVVMMTILMKANHAEKKWEFGGKIYNAKPGQFVTSAEKLAKDCGRGVTRANVRSALTRLEQYDFLTTQTTKVNTLITVVNWGIYQSGEKEITNKLSQRQPSDNQATTTNKNVKNVKNKDITLSSVETEPHEKVSIDYKGVIDYLNQQSGKHFRNTVTNQKLIRARLNEGFSKTDIKTAIDNVVLAWKNDDSRKQYIRPSTIFRPSNFEGYVNSPPYFNGGKGVVRETLPDWAQDDYVAPKQQEMSPEDIASTEQRLVSMNTKIEQNKKQQELEKAKELEQQPSKPEHTPAPDWLKQAVNQTGDDS